MTALACIMLTCLAIMNFVYAKSYLYPPVVFSAIWAMLLLGLALSGQTFYPLSFLALAVFFIGAAAFSCGSMSALMIAAYQQPKATIPPRDYERAFVDRVLNLALLAQVVIAPLYWRKLKAVSSLAGVDNLLVGLRIQASFPDAGERVGLGIFAYIVAMMTFFTLIALYESDDTRFRRYRAYLYIIITIGYQLVTAARSGTIFLIISLIVISIVKSGRIRWKQAAIGVLALLLVFSIPAVILKKGGSMEMSVAENISSISESLRDYMLPSLVAFDQTLNEKVSTGSLRSLRSFYAIANAFGAKITLPPDILEYAVTPIPTNLYTAYYFYYPDFGLAGSALCLFALGILSAFVYLYAMSGEPRGVIIYAMIATSLLMTGLSESFLSMVSFWIQAILVITIIYSRRLNKMFA